MPDREKVIKGLEWILEDDRFGFGENWGHGEPQDEHEKAGACVWNAIALLKEQEAVEPILEQDFMVCGVCGHDVIWQKRLGDGIWADEELDYCPHCGRAVKWEWKREAYVEFNDLPKPITGSFLTNEQAEQFKNAFKDFVQVVRCKDCRQNNQCSIQFKFADADNPGEWFCPYGKRRTEDA